MKKILIVEDDLSYLELLRERISEEGYDPLTATDGKQGLAVALKERPDLILLDIRMPIMDGLQMLSELRNDPYGAKVKVIMLTNVEPDETTIKKVLKEQPTYYLIKSDVKQSELMNMIQELFEDGDNQR